MSKKDLVKACLEKNGYIILDANVYLNIYYRSPEFSLFSMRVLESVREQIRIPSTVRREFKKNYKKCYNEQKNKLKNACAEIKNQLNSFKDRVSNQCEIIKKFQFPDIDGLKQDIFEKSDEIMDILDGYKDKHEISELVNKAFTKKDEIYEFVEWLVGSGKEIEAFSVDDLYSLTVEADKRYSKKIPPGFKDEKKNKGLARYGDYLIWEQTMRFAKKESAPIIFVTDDEKKIGRNRRMTKRHFTMRCSMSSRRE